MEKIKGIPIEFTLLDSLVKVSDLIYYDGPLLSHFQSNSGEDYLFYWVDSNETYNRWLIFRVNIESLQSYLNGKSSLYDIILSLDNCFIYKADINNALEYKNVELLYTYQLPDSYLPEKNSFYTFKTFAQNIDLNGYSKRNKQGVLLAYFGSSQKVGYGTIDSELYANSLIEIITINKGLRKSFIDSRKKYNKDIIEKKDKIDLNLIRRATTLEYFGNVKRSFGALFKPITNSIPFSDLKSIEDFYMEYVIEFYESSNDIEKFQEFTANLDKSVIDSYRKLLKIITASKTQFNLNWVNSVSNFSKINEISFPKANEILNNLQRLEVIEGEEIKITGRFVALNLKTGWYQFEDFEDDTIFSTGHLDSDRLEMAYKITWEKTYDVLIKRNEEKKTGNKKSKINDTIISFIEITDNNE